MDDEFVIIGAPVYGGRVAPEAVARLRRLRAHETPAGIVVVYGNRAYEDALLELRDLVIEQGFIPIAAAAFIGEHSYSTEATPIAHGRPDAFDLAQAQEFGALIRDRLAAPGVWRRTSPLPVPGAYPHREWIPPTDVAPITDEALCLRCGDCARACPTAAIAIGEVVMTNPASCILCTACVKNLSDRRTNVGSPAHQPLQGMAEHKLPRTKGAGVVRVISKQLLAPRNRP